MAHSRTLSRVLGALTLALAWSSQALAQERIQFGPPVRAEYDQSSRKLLPLSDKQPPADLASDAEVFLISGYEPSNKSAAGATVKVEVNRPGSKVLLVLTSHDKVNWHVAASPATTISGIVVAGYEQPTVTTMVNTQGYLAKLPHAYETENEKFTALIARLKTMFGIERLHGFRGSYSIPSVVSITAIDAPRAELTASGPTPRTPATNYAFNLMATDFTSVRWTLTGPPEDKVDKAYFSEGRIAFPESGQAVYRLSGDRLEITDRLGREPYTAALPANFPRFSWAKDLAYDTKRDIVSVVTLGGEGFLYRFDAKKRKWIDFRSLKNVDIISLAYDGKMDRYLAWTSNGDLLFVSGEGHAQFSKSVLSRLEGFGRLYDRGNGSPPRLTMVPNGDDVALVYMRGQAVKRIWHYDVKTGSAVLTY